MPNVAGEVSSLYAALPRTTFTIPEKLREWPGDPTTITMRQTTVAEELMAVTSAGGNPIKYAQEVAKHSLIEADGKKLTWENEEKTRFFEACSPKVRGLIGKAYDKLHIAPDDDVTAFLESAKTQV